MANQQSSRCIVLYRGSLERSRVAFILESLTTSYSAVEFIWIFPGKLTEKVQTIFNDFIKDFRIEKQLVLNQRLKDYWDTKKTVKQFIPEGSVYDLALIGGTASLFTSCFSPKRVLWFINGIPEEATMNNPFIGFFQSNFQWWIYTQLNKPDIIVTVSKRMSAYVAKHFPKATIIAVPTCVDISTFSFKGTPSKKKSGIFAYLGTGAPWQALDKLSVLWQAIHKKDQAIRFRIISRDPRCQILAQGIRPANIEFVQSNNFEEVAAFLHEAEAGFLIRRDNIVNRVSFPTKLAEYLATGCWVVASELDWDVTDYFNSYSIGFKAPLNMEADKLAEHILKYRTSIDWEMHHKQIEQCASVLDRKYWLEKLNNSLHKKQ